MLRKKPALWLECSQEKLLPHACAIDDCPLFCPYSLQLFHSVDFEIESSIDLQINIKLSK